jgi:alkaline phosphatase
VIVTADHETGGMSITGGDIQQGTVMAKFSTTDHTGIMVPVFAYGPGAELFQGVQENTDLFTKMMKLFVFSQY